MRLLTLSTVLFSLLIFGCKPDSNPDSKPETPTVPNDYETQAALSVTLDSLIKKGGGPCITGSDCMEIMLKWPVVEDGDEKIRATLNDSIQQYLIYHLQYNPDSEATTIEQITDSLIADYQSVYEDNEAYGLGWSIEVNGDMTFHDSIANLEIFNYSFAGGAHGNYFTEYTNFNTKTGKIIQYNDFVRDSTAFAALVETAFWDSIKEMSGENELTPDDFFWGEGFYLPENFKLGEATIDFIYNPYEAAAYAFGQLEFSIPYKDIEDITSF